MYAPISLPEDPASDDAALTAIQNSVGITLNDSLLATDATGTGIESGLKRLLLRMAGNRGSGVMGAAGVGAGEGGPSAGLPAAGAGLGKEAEDASVALPEASEEAGAAVEAAPNPVWQKSRIVGDGVETFEATEEDLAYFNAVGRNNDAEDDVANQYFGEVSVGHQCSRFPSLPSAMCSCFPPTLRPLLWS